MTRRHWAANFFSQQSTLFIFLTLLLSWIERILQ